MSGVKTSGNAWSGHKADGIRSEALNPLLHAPRSALIPPLLLTFYIPTRYSAGEARAMHLHFVQSLEPLQGAGLGQAALSLHLAMRAAHGEGGIRGAAHGLRLEMSRHMDILQKVHVSVGGSWSSIALVMPKNLSLRPKMSGRASSEGTQTIEVQRLDLFAIRE